MRDDAIQPFISKHRILMPMSWRHSCNAVRYHDKRESRNHFMFKCEIAYALLSRGQTVFSELKLPSRHDSPVADLFWLDEKTVIEFESEYTNQKAKTKQAQFAAYNVLVFDIKRLTIIDVLRKLGIEAPEESERKEEPGVMLKYDLNRK
jgi:hypothetical protein